MGLKCGNTLTITPLLNLTTYALDHIKSRNDLSSSPAPFQHFPAMHKHFFCCPFLILLSVAHKRNTVPSSPKIFYLLMIIRAKMTTYAYAGILGKPNNCENVELAPKTYK
jgi:hypothetical protein